MVTEGRRYTFHPRERRGVIVGLQPGQLAALAAGAIGALLVFQVAPNGAGLVAAVAISGLAVGAACLPLGGRPPVAWLPIGARWLGRRVVGPPFSAGPGRGHRLQRRSAASAPLDSQTGTGGEGSPHSSDGGCGEQWTTDDLAPIPTRRRRCRRDTLPPGIRLEAARGLPGSEPMGLVRDLDAGTLAAVFRVQGRSFSLLDPLAKDRRLAEWGALLAGLARPGSPVHRLQWVERTVPGDSDALSRYLAQAAPVTAPPDGAPSWQAARASYAALVAGAGPATQERETLLVVAVHPRRAARSLRALGRGGDGISEVLRREVHLLQGQLRTAELTSGPVLSVDDLARAIRTGFEPDAGRRLPRSDAPVDGGAAWPMASDEAWSVWRADGSWHVTYWVTEWPRVQVGPDFLAALLLSGGRRTMAVVMAPVSAAQAARQVASARTADLADDELRRRAGFVTTARRRREADGVLQREAELADGHAEYRFSGYVTVSASTREELEAACGGVEQAAQHSHLELRRLFGQQAEAFTWTLPLARGLS